MTVRSNTFRSKMQQTLVIDRNQYDIGWSQKQQG